MARYRVRSGQALLHGDLVVGEGAIVELPSRVGDDGALASILEPVEAPVSAPVEQLATRAYRVRDGHTLAHDGHVQPAGTIVDLPEHVAADGAVSVHIEPVAPEPPVADDISADAEEEL